MRRWHAERSLMMKRWRQEIAAHEFPDWPHEGLAPIPPTGDQKCHCYLGMGFMRKRKPHDCGNPRCGLCHFEKNYLPNARAEKKRRAIDYELRAHGL